MVFVDEGLASVRPLVLECRSPDVSLSDFFSASVYEKLWRIDQTRIECIRFGLLWKIYDLVAEKGVCKLGARPPCLQEHLSGFHFGDGY